MSSAAAPQLSDHPEAIRSRQRWAAKREESLAYHQAYRARRIAEDPEYQEKVRARARRAAAARRERTQAMVQAAKDRPCVDCGNRYPPQIMDLDHVREEKRFELRAASRGAYRTYAEIEREIAKCDPRCPTCHRLRHYHEDAHVDRPGRG